MEGHLSKCIALKDGSATDLRRLGAWTAATRRTSAGPAPRDTPDAMTKSSARLPDTPTEKAHFQQLLIESSDRVNRAS